MPIEPHSPAVGRRLDALGLGALGVEVTAVRRRGIRGADPGGELVLKPGDVVVLRGVETALQRAEDRLAQSA